MERKTYCSLETWPWSIVDRLQAWRRGTKQQSAADHRHSSPSLETAVINSTAYSLLHYLEFLHHLHCVSPLVSASIITNTKMSSPIKITRGANLVASGLQTEGMVRMSSFSDVSDQICSNLMVAKPKTASAVHHHGEEGEFIPLADRFHDSLT